MLKIRVTEMDKGEFMTLAVHAVGRLERKKGSGEVILKLHVAQAATC